METRQTALRGVAAALAALVLVALSANLRAADLDAAAGGSVVYAKGNEFIRPAAAASFEKAFVGAEVNTGDELVTGAFGSLAVVLRDETQIRLRHSSRFKIGEIRDTGAVETTRLELLAGAMWSRAQSLARQVTAGLARKPVVNVTIATATIGIRGTDWFVSVDETTGTARAVIISGAGDVSNSFGSVSLAAGEEAIVEPGKAPVKRVVVDLSGRPLMALEYDVDWRRLAGAAPGSALAKAAQLAAGGRFAEADSVLAGLPSPSSEAAVERFRVALLMNNADYDAAITLAQDARLRFPNTSDFDVLLGHAYLLTDQPDAMRSAIGDGQARNGDDDRLWHLRGIYYTLVQPDRDAALGAYRRAIALRADAGESLNNLGLLNFQLGHFDAAQDNLAAAREAMPDSALVHANSGFLAQNLDNPDEADRHLQRAESLDEASPHLHMARGTQALMDGDHAAAIAHFIKAIAIEPVLPGAHTALAIAYYQAGRFDEGRAMIDKAILIDPDDPVAPKIGTTMSLDQADIGRAIRLAKDALAKSLEYDYFAVESLASARSGITNLGAAYSSLGLTSWANYYAQLAFTPYEATSHFLLSNVYGARSNSAANGALNLGLVIAPTAISEPNRFFEFIREPGIDFTLGGSLGDAGGERTETGDATVQGFLWAPVPLAWRMDYSDNDSSDGRVSSQTLNISAGTRFGDRRHHLSTNLFATNSDSQNVNPINEIDRGDRSDSSSLAASLAYTLRLDYDNRIVARLGFQQLETGTRNLRPFGSSLSDLTQSLIINFGEQATRGIAGQGLYDLNAFLGPPCAPTDPCIGISDFFAVGFGATPIPADVPPLVADDIFVSTDSRDRSYYLQLRHMLRLGEVDLSYGVEFIERESLRKFVINDSEFVGVGTLIDDMVNFFPFALFQTVSDASRATTRPDSGFAFAQARYEYSEDIWFEGGLFGRYYNDDVGEESSQIDPRIGAGWRVRDKHWLRAAWQRELIMPVPPVGPLAPVATMGFVPIVTQVLDGSSIKNTQLQWDAEWHDRLFTSLRLEEQSIDGWSPINVPVNDFVFSQEARIRTVDLNINLWLAERFGVFANYLHQDTENQENGIHQGRDLPFVADDVLVMGISYIHPRQVTASASVNYVGERFGNLGNTVVLDDYWTTSFSLRWAPLQKHVALGVSVINVFDQDFEIAPGLRSAGRAAAVSLQARF